MSLPVGQANTEWNLARVKVQSIGAGVAAPDFEAVTLEGKPFRLSDLRGKVVLVDFWATWCGPCIAELPNVKSLHDKYADEDFAVVGISFDSDAAIARKFVADRQLPWTQIWAEGADEGPIASKYGVGGIPATFLIGPDGKVIERDLRGDELAAVVARALRKPSRGADLDNPVAAAFSRAVEGLKSILPPALPAESPEARAALDAIWARYRALTSYRDRFAIRALLVTKDGSGPQTGVIEGTLAWTQGRIAMMSDVEQIHANGRKFTRYWPSAGQYLRQDQPADLAVAFAELDWAPFGEIRAAIHPLARVLASENGKSPILVVTGVEPEAGPGRVLFGRYRVDGLAEGGALPFEAFVDEESGLFKEIRIDYTEGYRSALRESSAGDPEAVERAEIVISFSDIETNGAIDEAVFTLNAPGAREFNAYSAQSVPAPQPQELVSRAAPALEGTTRDGLHFDLAECRGHSVVVLFWATWSPLAETVLRELQETLAGKDPDVSLLGVCRNGPAGAAAAGRTLARSGATFPQIDDLDARIGEAWNVTALPLIFVVGPDGRVKATYVSWSEETRIALSALPPLSSAVAPDVVAIPLAAPRGPDSGPLGVIIKGDNAPLGDQRVREGDVERIFASSWNASEQDVDGDGEAELLLPNWQGGISVLKPSTGTVQQLHFSGTEGMGMQTARAVRIDGETCWLCSSSRFSSGGSAEKMLVGLYSPRGEVLWNYQPQLPGGRGGQARAVGGDMDGDGRVEFAIALTTYVREQTGEHEYTLNAMESKLVWLDDQGRCIAEREIAGQVELLYLSQAPPGQPATLYCFGGGQLARYTLARERADDHTDDAPAVSLESAAR